MFSLRFMLPALTALFVLLSAATTRLAVAASSRSRLLSVLLFAPALAVAIRPANGIVYAVGVHKEQVGLIAAGHYLREALPANAAIFTMSHGGGLAHYTGRMIVRFDPLPRESLDAIVDDVLRHGYRPVLLLDVGEQSLFQTLFPQSQFHSLDWPPRAEFGDVIPMRYWDLADRDDYREGRRWSIDIIRKGG